jgi:hypothetical protein
VAERVINVSISPSTEQIKAWLTKALLKDLEGLHPDEVVIVKGQRKRWRKKYSDDDLVNIVTARDSDVCKACLEMAQHSPYRYGDAKKQLPHHPGCRCQIASLHVHDAGYLRQPTFKKVRQYLRTALKESVKHKGKKMPQRGATIKRLRRKRRRFVAPSGYRSISLYRRKGK